MTHTSGAGTRRIWIRSLKQVYKKIHLGPITYIGGTAGIWNFTVPRYRVKISNILKSKNEKGKASMFWSPISRGCINGSVKYCFIPCLYCRLHYLQGSVWNREWNRVEDNLRLCLDPSRFLKNWFLDLQSQATLHGPCNMHLPSFPDLCRVLDCWKWRGAATRPTSWRHWGGARAGPEISDALDENIYKNIIYCEVTHHSCYISDFWLFALD